MKILVADDEEILIEFLSRSLGRDGHEVEAVNDGLQAYSKIIGSRYDAVVLDVVMPGLNGIDVCKDVRAAGVQTPILVLSSKDTEQARIEGLDAGADDYMVKPFGYDELTARLRAITRRKLGRRSNKSMSLGPMTIDPESRVVTLGEKHVPLRPKEYGLLLCLMQRSGKGVSKSDLLHTTWGVGHQHASTRLPVCVKSLRERLAAADVPNTPVIRCIRRFGYCIELPSADEAD